METKIASTIIEQILSIDKWSLGSYAAQNLKVIKEGGDFRGGLYFECNGYNVKGAVSIRLHWNDTYTILFHNDKGKVMREVTSVYFESLVEVLDFIEEKNHNQNPLSELLSNINLN